jgi:hypothetical protein
MEILLLHPARVVVAQVTDLAYFDAELGCSVPVLEVRKIVATSPGAIDVHALEMAQRGRELPKNRKLRVLLPFRQVSPTKIGLVGSA